MRVVSIYPTKSFKLILEFEDGTTRLFDIKNIPANPTSNIADIQNNKNLFLTASIDSGGRTVSWLNEVVFGSQLLYEQSINFDDLTNINNFRRIEKNTTLANAILLLKGNIIARKELIENYEYYLKHDLENNEREEIERALKKIKNEILSYQQAVYILEAQETAI